HPVAHHAPLRQRRTEPRRNGRPGLPRDGGRNAARQDSFHPRVQLGPRERRPALTGGHATLRSSARLPERRALLRDAGEELVPRVDEGGAFAVELVRVSRSTPACEKQSSTY